MYWRERGSRSLVLDLGTLGLLLWKTLAATAFQMSSFSRRLGLLHCLNDKASLLNEGLHQVLRVLLRTGLLYSG